MPVPAPKDHYTFADCLTWGESERIEIINGEAVMMAPPSRTHQEVSGALFAQLYTFLEGKKCRVYSAPFAVRLFEKDGDNPEDVDTMVEPDISVVCDSSKLDDAGCKGAPDLVMEILSPSTMRHDRFTKFNLYHVPESENTGSLIHPPSQYRSLSWKLEITRPRTSELWKIL